MDLELLYKACSQLMVISKETGTGDCIECNIDPQHISRYGNEHFIVRQISKNRWRVWRKS